MPRCTLHVGMPKTGTSSIQDAFFLDLRVPGIQYAGCGDANGSYGMLAIFGPPETQQQHFQRKQDIGGKGFTAYQHVLRGRLDRAVAHARQRDDQLVISGEEVYGFTEEAFERLRDYLAGKGFDTEPIGYLRPWKSYAESLLQQRLKMGRNCLTLDTDRDRGLLAYRAPIERMWRVFGRDQATFVRYDPSVFPSGCVVRDFCERLGVPAPRSRRPRQNDSLSLPALRLLFAYNRDLRMDISDTRPLPRKYGLLVNRMHALQGDPLRLHSSLLRPLYNRLEPDLDWLEQELGFSLHEPLIRDDNGPCIRSEDDMLDFDEASLDWLASTTGQRLIRRTTREQTARAVAECVNQLRQRLSSPREFLMWQSLTWRSWYARWRYAV